MTPKIKDKKNKRWLAKQSKFAGDKNLSLKMRALIALHNYRNSPESFNSYPEEMCKDDASLLMEYFCESVNNKKPILNEALEYFRDCFENVLKDAHSLERCFNFTKRNKKNPDMPPEYLNEMTHDIMDKGINLNEACIIQKNKTGIKVKTLNQHFNEFAETLFDSWLIHQVLVKKKIYRDFRKELKVHQITAIKKYFKYTISDNGLIFIKSESKKI
jgi:hypothetical protein